MGRLVIRFLPLSFGMALTLCLHACSDDEKTTESPPTATDASGVQASDAAQGDPGTAEPSADASAEASADASVMDGEAQGDGASGGTDAAAARDVRQITDADFKPLADRGEPDNGETCDEPVNEEDCDTTKRPFVFVHGTIGSGENFEGPFQLFASNGYCSSYLKAVDYNSMGENPIEELDAIIARLQEETGFDEVDLAGHSQGSGHGSRYAAANPDKIARYIHLAGGCPGVVRGTPIGDDNPGADPGGVPTLTLSSIGDMPVERCGTTANVCLQNMYLDHFAVASSVESFVEMYKFLNDGEEPQNTTVQCEDNIVLEGRALTFGDSQFMEGAKIEVYELGDEPWERDDPAHTFDVGADGWVGPFDAKRGVSYEFKMLPPEEKADSMPVRYSYFPPFVRSDRWIRFLYRSENSAALATNRQVNFTDDHAVLVVRMKRGGLHYGQHSMLVDGFEIVNADNAPTPATNVGYYLYDAAGEGEGESNGGTIVSGVFVNSCDVFMQAATPAFIEVEFENQTVKVPNWPSGGGVLSLVMFD